MLSQVRLEIKLKAANNDILAILDSKTIPKNSWLEQGLNKLDKNDVIWLNKISL